MDFAKAAAKEATDIRRVEVEWLLEGAREAGVDVSALDFDQLLRFQVIQHAMWPEFKVTDEYRAAREREQAERDRKAAEAEATKKANRERKEREAAETEQPAKQDAEKAPAKKQSKAAASKS